MVYMLGKRFCMELIKNGVIHVCIWFEAKMGTRWPGLLSMQCLTEQDCM